MHDKPGQRTRNQKGDPDQPEKIPGEKSDDLAHRSAQHFPDADLFYALFRSKNYQTQQTKTGDEDGQGSKKNGELRNDKLILIKVFILIARLPYYSC